MLANFYSGRKTNSFASIEYFSLFSMTVVALVVGMSKGGMNFYDEGIVLYGSQRVAEGYVPYRDFWTMYGPSQFWIVGGLFKIFGSSIAVERAWDLVVRALISVLIYSLSKKLTNTRAALFIWLLSIVWLSTVGFHGFPVLPATLMIIASSIFFVDYIWNRTSINRLLYAGIFVGLAATFRHDLGFYAFASEVVTLLIYRTEFFQPSDGSQVYVASRWREISVLSSGAAIAGIPALAYLVSVVPVENLVNQLIIFPATTYREVRSLPYPSAMGLLGQSVAYLLEGKIARSLSAFSNIFTYYFHLLVVVLSILLMVTQSARKEFAGEFTKIAGTTAFFCILVILLSIKSTVRPHAIHLIHAIIPAFLLGGIIVSHYRQRLYSLPSLMIISSMVLMAIRPAYGLVDNISRFVGQLECSESCVQEVYRQMLSDNHDFSRAKYFNLDESQSAAVRHVQENTAPSDNIYVGNSSHQKVFVNDILFYFLSERHSATIFHELHPGQITTEAAQRLVIKELSKSKAPYVIIVDKWDNVTEPNGSSRISKADDLDRYLSKHYSETVRFGSYSIRRIHDNSQPH